MRGWRGRDWMLGYSLRSQALLNSTRKPGKSANIVIYGPRERAGNARAGNPMGGYVTKGVKSRLAVAVQRDFAADALDFRVRPGEFRAHLPADALQALDPGHPLRPDIGAHRRDVQLTALRDLHFESRLDIAVVARVRQHDLDDDVSRLGLHVHTLDAIAEHAVYADGIAIPAGHVNGPGHVGDLHDALGVRGHLLVENTVVGRGRARGAHAEREPHDGREKGTHDQIPSPAWLALCTSVRTRISSW